MGTCSSQPNKTDYDGLIDDLLRHQYNFNDLCKVLKNYLDPDGRRSPETKDILTQHILAFLLVIQNNPNRKELLVSYFNHIKYIENMDMTEHPCWRAYCRWDMNINYLPTSVETDSS